MRWDCPAGQNQNKELDLSSHLRDFSQGDEEMKHICWSSYRKATSEAGCYGSRCAQTQLLRQLYYPSSIGFVQGHKVLVYKGYSNDIVERAVSTLQQSHDLVI